MKKLTDFELDLKIENGKQLIFLQAHDRVVNGEFNFSKIVWDFSLTNMVGFGLSIYALHFQFGVVMLLNCIVRGEPERKGRGR